MAQFVKEIFTENTQHDLKVCESPALETLVLKI
jgi:hypothetical protein